MGAFPGYEHFEYDLDHPTTLHELETLNTSEAIIWRIKRDQKAGITR